ncbi:MAG: hypothetical protein BMS9Abin13_490 [Patescibacteria group bacterium]|nr:MAG: hypothetical protein BMS9Abin13_490 [Patescibacteria group bacterium]
MTAKIFRKPSSVKLPMQKQELRRDEYGKAKKGIAICKVCHNVNFKKKWHHPDCSSFKNVNLKGKGVRLVVCPADKMIAEGLYEGEIRLVNVPKKYESELLNLVAGYGARARKRDPQDRIIEIKKAKNGFVVTTTENQLAIKLAKKIKGVFNKVDIVISHSHEPYEVERMRVTFL